MTAFYRAGVLVRRRQFCWGDLIGEALPHRNLQPFPQREIVLFLSLHLFFPPL